MAAEEKNAGDPGDQRDLEDLFFGSARVALTVVPGEAVRFDPDAWAVDMTASALAVTHARSERLAAEPGMPADIVVPCIPARELVSTEENGPEKDVSMWPLELQHPLLKVPLGSPGALPCKAVASGARSCLIKIPKSPTTQERGSGSGGALESGTWFRLKGCGNHDEGFVVRQNPATKATAGRTGKASYRDLRGSAFVPTAARENFMTARLSASLEGKRVPGCNQAMGFYVYAEPHCPFGSANPELVPACIVEQTRGDRRLGSHVFAGIELLLPALLDVHALGPAYLEALFPFARRELNKSACNGGDDQQVVTHAFPTTVPTTAELAYYHSQLVQAGEAALWTLPEKYHALLREEDNVEDGTTGLEQEPEGRHNDGSRVKTFPLDASLLADLFHATNTEFPERAPACGDYPQQWTKDGPRPMADNWKALWDATAASLAATLEIIKGRRTDGEENSKAQGSTCKTVLGYLFWHLGRDCGRFLRELHELRISWGTYQDEMCRRDYDEWHCNAHANNVVLLTEEDGTRLQSFLSYLDLDMAFDEKTFVDTWASGYDTSNRSESSTEENLGNERVRRSSSSSSSSDVKQQARKERHDKLLARENANFMEVLVGGDSSNGVPQIAKVAVEAQDTAVQTCKTALYDTFLLAYQDAYSGRGESSDSNFDPELHTAAYAVCKLAVIIMADFVA